MSVQQSQPQVQGSNQSRGETQDRNEKAGDIRSTNIAAAKGIFNNLLIYLRIGGSLEKLPWSKGNG